MPETQNIEWKTAWRDEYLKWIYGFAIAKYYYESSDFWVEFRKDIYNEDYLHEFDLNERQLKAVMYVKDKGEITNKIYQELFGVSKATATRDLTEIIDKFKLLERKGEVGAGTVYKLIGS